MHWEAARFFTIGSPEVVNMNSVRTFWAKWPSGAVNDSRVEVDFDYITPRDETLIRTIAQCGFTWLAPSLDSFMAEVGIGLIAWDSANPDDFDRVITDAALVPSPLSTPELDWVHRKVFMGQVLGNGSLAFHLMSTGLQTTADSWSRAQHKLPDGKGLLMAIEFQAAGLDFGDVPPQQIGWDFEYRMLFKDP